MINSLVRTLILACFSACYLIVSGQTSEQVYTIPKVTPPSPNAASLGKYGDIPVGLSTGIPNINIPLYTIQVGKFSLPVSLSYHSQGLKVEEKAGWVGHSWSLNAGGVITRSIHGLADEGGGGFWNYSGWTDDNVAALPAIAAFCGGAFYDNQPDIFYYNFGNYSGKFVMDQTVEHKAHCIPFNNLRISHDVSLNALSKFQVIDENGITYVFDMVEKGSDESPATFFNTAWYLTKISTPGGDINFNYTQETTYALQFSETNFLNVVPSGSANEFNPGRSTTNRVINNNSVILTSITFPTGSIVFTSGSRQDFGNASALKGMTVYDINNNPRHKFVFTQSYFGNTGSNVPEDVRLKLDKVSEVAIDDNTNTKDYNFEYYNPSDVPSVKSMAQDSWGFYNGQDGNNSLLPFIDPIVYGPFVASQAVTHGNRDISAGFAQTGVLHKITYPTGGTTELIYEGNEYSYVGGSLTSKENKIQQHLIAMAVKNANASIMTNTRTFSIDEVQDISLNITGSYSGPTPVENGPTIILNKINSDGSRTNIFTQYMVNSTINQYAQLNIGNYELIASVDGATQQVTGNLAYTYKDGTIIRRFPAGGIRIAQIINRDPVSGVSNTKSFQYDKPTDNTVSSGNLISVPINVEFLQSSYSFGAYYLESSGSLNYLGTTQGSHISYGAVTEIESGTENIGKKISYFNAYDYADPPGSVHWVTNPGDVTGAVTSLYRYKTDMSVYRGLPVKEEYYNSDNNIIRQSTTIYNTSESLNTSGDPNYYELNAIAGYNYRICGTTCGQCRCVGPNCNSCIPYVIENYTLADYKVVCPWVYKTSTTDIVYDQHGNNPLTTTTNYFYDNASHGLVTRTVTTNSKGETLKSVFKYPGDQSTISGLSTEASDALASMVAINKIAPVIETSTYNGNSLLKLTRTDYKIWQATNNVIEPKHVWGQVYSHAIEDRLDFQSYDEHGNLLEAAKANDVKEVYLWGYNSQYSVAKITNTTYDIAINKVTQSILNNPADDVTLRAHLNNLRSIPGAHVTTYTYKPLIGITSETDPNGRTTYYEYDELGRLKLIKDQDSNILKTFDYKYQQ